MKHNIIYDILAVAIIAMAVCWAVDGEAGEYYYDLNDLKRDMNESVRNSIAYEQQLRSSDTTIIIQNQNSNTNTNSNTTNIEYPHREYEWYNRPYNYYEYRR